MDCMSHFETLFIAAVTSAAVALAIEWAAKPRLEARKDRVLEQSRAKREVEYQLGIIVGLSASLITDISAYDLDDDSEEEEVILGLLEEWRVEIIAASKAVRRALDVVGIKIDRQVRDVVYRSMGFIQVYASACDLGTEDTGLALTIVSGRALDMYHTRPWQIQKRRKLAAEGTSLPDAADEDG
jgi:hypothetical protein